MDHLNDTELLRSVRGEYHFSFEGGTIDPFWSTFINGGPPGANFAALTTDEAYDGVQSVMLSATGSPPLPVAGIEHSFSSPQQGTFSAFIFATPGSTTWMGISTNDSVSPFCSGSCLETGYQQYPLQNQPAVWDSTAGYVAEQGYSAYGWHELTFSVGDGGSTVDWDGTQIYAALGLTNFTTVDFYAQGGGVAYVDDVTLNTSDAGAAPEPGTLSGIVVAVCVCFVWRRGMSRKG